MEAGLRIAHVQPFSIDLFGYRDDDWGTTFRFFLPNMAAAQAARGDRPVVHALTAGGGRVAGPRDVVDGVPLVLHRCVEPQRGGVVQRRFSRQVSLSLLRALRPDDVDVVHFHGCRSLHAMLGATAARCRLAGLPLVAQEHGPRAVGPVMRRVQLEGLRRCDALVAGNEESEAELRALAPAVPVHRVPNGVDPAVFHPDDSLRHGRPFRVLVVSRLMADKDPLTAARAVAEVARRGTALDVTVVGAGELRDAVEGELQAAAVPVTMVDKLPQPELAARYRDSHVLLLTSLREGFNQATLEAMASGTPVVASDIAGVREGVGDAGRLVLPGEVTGFADEIERLATDADAWADHRARSLEQAGHFAWPAIADQLDAVYREAIAAAPAPAPDGVAEHLGHVARRHHEGHEQRGDGQLPVPSQVPHHPSLELAEVGGGTDGERDPGRRPPVARQQRGAGHVGRVAHDVALRRRGRRSRRPARRGSTGGRTHGAMIASARPRPPRGRR